ncbi:cupin domain-containing protein [bacterium]|nr:hypothetical protein [Gemmatimonadota bacterium]MCH2663187.1 cupin domain-containing protein [bacterium]HCK09139.1 hypothetical protein [Candidatus Latescibacterota bacterium]|tara:strand:+ start:947 stop:1357 length:411 start_codon:yes stop_codon:yes gene_type:complete
MPRGKVIDPDRVKPFILDQSYSSKLLTDDDVAGTPAININEGTLKGGCSTGAGVHEETELYYAVRGEAILYLDGEPHEFNAGMVAVIPGGVHHSLDNKSDDDDFVLLTFWQKADYNGVHHKRLEAWGTSFKTIDED